MKKIILTLILLLNISYAVDYKNISFADFIRELSHASGKNIVISGNIDTNFNVFFPTFDHSNKDKVFEVLIDVLAINDLDFKTTSQSIIIFKKKPEIDLSPPAPKVEEKEKENYYVVKFRYLLEDDVKKALSIFKDVGVSVFKDRVLVRCLPSQLESIEKMISSLDASYQLRQLAITVISTDNSKIKDLGADFSIFKEFDNSYIKLVTSTASLQTTVKNPLSFTSFINAMSQKGFSNIIYSPVITVLDGKDAVLEDIKDVPISTGSTTTQNAQTTTMNTKTYRKVGLKLNIKNVVIFDDRITFSLDLYIENVMDNTESPRINQKHVQTHVYLDNTNSFFLAGLNTFEQKENESNIPIIENIPILGYLTKHTVTNISDLTFSVFITLSNATSVDEGSPASAGDMQR